MLLALYTEYATLVTRTLLRQDLERVCVAHHGRNCWRSHIFNDEVSDDVFLWVDQTWIVVALLHHLLVFARYDGLRVRLQGGLRSSQEVSIGVGSHGAHD